MLKTIAMISLGLCSLCASGEPIGTKVIHHGRVLYVTETSSCRYTIKHMVGYLTRYAKILDTRACNAWQYDDEDLVCNQDSTDIYCVNAFKIIDAAKTQNNIDNQERYKIKRKKQQDNLHTVIGE